MIYGAQYINAVLDPKSGKVIFSAMYSNNILLNQTIYGVLFNIFVPIL